MPTYTYTPNTPNPADAMNTTASLMQANFQAINEFAGINHIGFNITDSGKHNLALMPFLTPNPTVIANDINVYTQATGSPNVAEIFMQYPTGTIAQLSGTTTGGGGAAPTFGTGWIKFSSGTIIKYGTYTMTGASYFYFPTGAGIPVFTTPIYAKVTPVSNPSSPFGNQPTASVTAQYIFGGSNISLPVNYFVIGV